MADLPHTRVNWHEVRKLRLTLGPRYSSRGRPLVGFLPVHRVERCVCDTPPVPPPPST